MAVLAVAECACIAAVQIAISDPAQAQSRQRRGGGFFQQLFGVPSQPRIIERKRAPARVDYSQAPSPRRPDPNAEPVEPTTTIVVMGDGMADWLAYGLEDAFSEAPEIAIVRASKAYSGLMRYDRKNDLDWWDAAGDILAKEKANYVVMLLGVSDRRNIREKDIEEDAFNDQASQEGDAAGQQAIVAPESKRVRKRNGVVEFRSDEWEKVYSRRIDRTVAALKSKGVPVFWVGLPSIRGTRSTADAVYLNDLYRARAERAGAVYIDVWDGFVDEAGKYSSYGPDYEGQRRRLRSGDGVYFTEYGARKIAHYVEREIRRYMNNRGPIALPFGPMGPVPADGTVERPLAGPVVPLTTTTGNNQELLGGVSAVAARTDAIATGVLVKDAGVTAPVGRADDFAWPPGSAAKPAADKPATDKAVPDKVAPGKAAAVPAVVPAKPVVAIPAPVVTPEPAVAAKPSAAKPFEAKPSEVKPVEIKPVKPVASKPAEKKPARAAERKPRPPQAVAPRPPQHATAPRPPRPVRRSSDDGLFGSNGPFGWIRR